MTMFAVVNYNDYRKEVDFKIHMVTNDIEEAKKIAFQHSSKLLKEMQKDNKDKDNQCEYKITTNNESKNYVKCLNKIVMTYTVICVLKRKNKAPKLEYAETSIYAVVELPREIKETGDENRDGNIDSSLLCNDYYPEHYSSDDDSEE